MRYTAGRDTAMLRRASLGPAAIAQTKDQFRRINLGLPQVRYVNNDMMRRGGSFGAQGIRSGNALGCLCGPGDPGFLGAVAASAPPAKLSTAAPGYGANSKYLPNYSYGVASGFKIGVVVPAASATAVATPSHVAAVVVPNTIAAALAANYTARPVAGKLAGFGVYLGALGTGDASGAIKGASSGASVGSVIPVVGTAVGAVVGAVVAEALQLMKAREGKAAKSWDALVPQLRSGVTGSLMTEVTFAEGMKGMMDENGKMIPGCGPNAHKNPDCLMQPLANAIIAGYVQGRVPLNANTDQVFANVVLPWLQGGGGGIVWQVLSQLPVQQLMFKAATDRYLHGMPITRADMVEPVYKNDPGYNNFHTPSLVQGLVNAGVLQLQNPTAPASATNPVTGYTQPVASAPSSAVAAPGYVQPGVGLPNQPGVSYTASPGAPPSISSASIVTGGTSAPVSSPVYSSGGGSVSLPAVAAGPTGAPVAAPASGGIANLPWGLIAAIGGGLLLT